MSSKDPKITCGIYLYSKPIKKFLICHATKSPWNLWSIPKGLNDPGEDYFRTAERELFEETGIVLVNLDVEVKLILPEVPYKKQNKSLHSYFVSVSDDLSKVKFTCQSFVNESYPEIDKYALADLEEIKTKLHESQVENLEMIDKKLKEIYSK